MKMGNLQFNIGIDTKKESDKMEKYEKVNDVLEYENNNIKNELDSLIADNNDLKQKIVQNLTKKNLIIQKEKGILTDKVKN